MDKKIKEWKQASSSFDFDEKFVIKQMKRNKYRTIFISTLKTCLCACALLFVLVNTNTDYVKATKDIPILNKINELFSLNKNMLVAIENDYIQELNIVKEEGNIKVKVDYMVVDEKNIYLFYQVFEKNNRLSNGYQASIELNMDGFSSSSNYTETEEYDIMQYNIHYVENEIKLESFDFIVNCKAEEIIIPITIDQDSIAKHKTYNIDQTIDINGQKFYVTQIEVYPLSMNVYTKQDDANTHIIENVEFELKLDGKVRDKDLGIQATGFGRDTGIYDETYYMPSTYFLSDNFELMIKSAELIKKPGIVIYDLETNTFDDPTNTFKEITLYTEETLMNPNYYQTSFHSYDYYFELKLNDHLVLEDGKGAISLSWLGNYGDYVNDDGDVVIQCFINDSSNNNKFYFYPIVGEKVEINQKVKLK